MAEAMSEADEERPPARRHRRLLVFALWNLLAGSNAATIYLTYLHAGRPASLWSAVSASFLDFYTWAAFTPLVFRFVKRFPLDRERWAQHIPPHLLAGAIFSFVTYAITIPLFWLVGGVNRAVYPTYPGLVDFFTTRIFDAYNLHYALMVYWVIVAVGHAIRYYEKYRGGEIRASRFQAQIAQAQLQALRMQLHPHFLFNTLHTISVLMREDVEAANRVLVRLSELLRLTLDNAGRHEVPLKQELEFLETYLEIEQTRFQDRLTVRLDIDPATLEAQVPNLLLQPLVENAIRHGVAPRAAPGVVEVRAARRDGNLELMVRDNGPGLVNFAPSSESRGIGLANTRARLERLYSADYELDLSDAAGGGLQVTVTIPYRLREGARGAIGR